MFLGKLRRRVIIVGSTRELRSRTLIESVTNSLLIFIQAWQALSETARGQLHRATTHLTLVTGLSIWCEVLACMVFISLQRRYLIVLVDEWHKCRLSSIGVREATDFLDFPGVFCGYL